MQAFYDAVERLTAWLSFRIEHTAKQRCWAVHFSAYTSNPQKGTVVRLYSSMLHLPRGCYVTFMPRPLAELERETWYIDIRRNDGVVRPSWAEGLRIEKFDGKYEVMNGSRPLTDADLLTMMEALEKPGLSGLLLDISRSWSMRFGAMPMELGLALEAIRDFDRLDTIHSRLNGECEQAELERLILQGTSQGT